jgi:pre-rRNA-processing protein TSR2
MVDEFEVNVDDDSGTEVATNILKARLGCAIGQFDEVAALRTRWTNRKGTKVDQMFKKAEDADQDTDWESDDSDDDDEGASGADVDMEEAPALVPAPKQKEEPQVDDDGFTMVTKKKR